MLKFSPANTKTKQLKSIPSLAWYLVNRRKIYSLDMLSGWSCPGALDCLSKVHEVSGKRSLKDGPSTKFRCFSASQEIVYPNVYNARKHNYDIMKQHKTVADFKDEILNSMPKNLGILRYHVGGGFFNRAYFQAALEIAEQNPDRLFYAYMKSINFLTDVDMMDPSIGMVLPNFLVTASYGGRHDHLIEKLGLRTAKVVFSEAEAGNLPIDHDDSHAATIGGSFALLLHGVQPKGSEASKALVQLKGKGSYGKKR